MEKKIKACSSNISLHLKLNREWLFTTFFFYSRLNVADIDHDVKDPH